MKTFLKVLALISAINIPSALAVEFAGIRLPATIDSAHAFATFVVSLIVLLAFTDYTSTRKVITVDTAICATGRPEKACHALAA